MKMNLKHRTGRKYRKTKNYFSKDNLENADLSKPAQSKIMITNE